MAWQTYNKKLSRIIAKDPIGFYRPHLLFRPLSFQPHSMLLFSVIGLSLKVK